LLAGTVYGQFEKPPKVRIGGSVGLGGMHLYFKPSFDVELWNAGTGLRIAPGLFFFSVGLQQRVGYFAKKRRNDRPLYLSLYYSYPWLLSAGRAPIDKVAGYKTETHFLALLVGMRFWLDRPKRLFIEASLGPMYVYRGYTPTEASRPTRRTEHLILPAFEIRLTLLAQFHKKFVQGQPGHTRRQRIIY
jgi:hypothetical protein